LCVNQLSTKEHTCMLYIRAAVSKRSLSVTRKDKNAWVKNSWIVKWKMSNLELDDQTKLGERLWKKSV